MGGHNENKYSKVIRYDPQKKKTKGCRGKDGIIQKKKGVANWCGDQPSIAQVAGKDPALPGRALQQPDAGHSTVNAC